MMCYGDLFPKYQLRDIEARVVHLSSQHIRQDRAVPVAIPGYGLWVRAIIARLLQKDASHA